MTPQEERAARIESALVDLLGLLRHPFYAPALAEALETWRPQRRPAPYSADSRRFYLALREADSALETFVSDH